MAVLEFLFTGIADVHDFHIERELIASQRMVAININIKAPDLQYSHLDLAVIGLQIENLSDRNFSNTFYVN